MSLNPHVSLDSFFAKVFPSFNLAYSVKLTLEQFDDFTSSIKVLNEGLYLFHFFVIQNLGRGKVLLRLIRDLLVIELSNLGKSLLYILDEFAF